MPHIHTEIGQYDVTVGTYVFRLDTPEPSIMLHMHRNLKAYMQFGGHIELTESPWDAALREVEEESGYAASQLQVLQPSQRMTHIGEGVLHPTPLCLVTYPYGGNTDHFHSDIAYAFVATGKPQQGVAVDESDDMRLFTRSEVIASEGKMPPSVRDIALFVFDEVLPGWQRVDVDNYARTELATAPN
jgi:8-oxo-dGTP diphosphatase